MRKWDRIIALCLALGLLLTGCGDRVGDESEDVYVDSVGELAGMNGFAGVQNRFAGMVEPQATLKVNPEQGRTVKTTLVEEGQSVQEGDPLFVYDTEEIQFTLEQAQLEIEQLDNSISTYYSEIAALEEEKKSASEDNQLQYTIEIQNRLASIKQAEYDKKVKQTEMDKQKNQMENDTVYSTMTGVVQSIDETVLDGDTTDMYGQEKTYITLMASGEYRIKAKINEQNVHQITPGSAVLVRSRVFEDQTWTGVISEIDTSQTEDNVNGMYYGMSNTDASQTSSSYAFYIVLDSYDGLILGQHVYVELLSESAGEDLLAIPSAYLMQEGDQWYVWADRDGKLEKRAVTLGTYYEVEDTYEILSGLTPEDYIASPREGLSEGQTTTRNMMQTSPEDQGGMMP
ncbi:MAG: efflux RND transporter periplasmic adaptor subunit [Lachnospirales bacterium]